MLCLVLAVAAGLLPHVIAAETVDDLNEKYEVLEQKIADRNKKINQAESDIKNSEQKIAALQEQVGDLEAQKKLINDKIAVLNTEIESLNRQIAELDAEVKRVNKRIADTKAEMEQREQEMEETLQLLTERIRASYLAGKATWLEVLVSSGDLSTFLTRTELLSRAAENDQALVSQLEEEAAELQKLQDALAADKSAVEAKRAVVNNQRAMVVAKKNDLKASASTLQAKENEIGRKTSNINQLIKQLDKDSALYKQQIAQIEKEQRQIEERIDALIKSEGSSEGEEPKKNYNATGKMTLPVPYDNYYVSAYYGPYSPFGKSEMHYGVDLCVRPSSYGKKIVAADGGIVILADASNPSSGFGKYIIIDHGNGVLTLYGHCSALFVKKGDKVAKGEHIANIGDTGRVTGPHLHFEVRLNNNGNITRVNPIPKYINP